MSRQNNLRLCLCSKGTFFELKQWHCSVAVICTRRDEIIIIVQTKKRVHLSIAVWRDWWLRTDVDTPWPALLRSNELSVEPRQLEISPNSPRLSRRLLLQVPTADIIGFTIIRLYIIDNYLFHFFFPLVSGSNIIISTRRAPVTVLTQSDEISLISDSLGRFRNVLVFTHFAAFSPMNDTHRSTNDFAPLPPADIIISIHH